MPEALPHRRCKRVVAKIIRGPQQERLIRKGLRADRAGVYKGKPVFAEIDCKHVRGGWKCWYTIYDKKTARVLLSRICPRTRRNSV